MIVAPRPVLVVTRKLDLGGTERHLLQVLPRLNRARFQVTLFALHGGGQLETEMRAAGIPVETPPPGAPVWKRLPTAVLRLSRLVRQQRPILHFFLPEGYLVGGSVGAVLGHDDMFMSRRSLNCYQKHHPVAAVLERLLHRRMRVVLANAQAVARDLAAEGVPEDRIHILYNGVPDQHPTRPRPLVRNALGLGHHSLVMIIVANLIPYKGHSDLLAALAGIKADLPIDWVLLCVGRDDGIGPALQEQANALGLGPHIRFLGQRRDIPDLLGAADIGLLCSHEEGFSNAILEGMGACLPMVTTDVGGNAEAILHNHCGLVVPPNDPEALGSAIRRVALDPALRLTFGLAAKERCQTVFSLDACVAGYEAIYDAVGQKVACR